MDTKTDSVGSVEKVGSDARSRLLDEYHEVDTRRQKLLATIVSNEFNELQEPERVDLQVQLEYMKAYCEVLLRRMRRQLDS